MKDLWWQKGIIYQIYPRSFQDTNNDGIGDLPGIIQRLDYLQWLGIDAIWISPVYPSPMADFGYDVSNHTDIHPLFGCMADMDQLIAAAHQRKIKVVLDFVPNHTSVEHPWFQESRKSRENPKRDWFIWQDAAADGGPPNNWLSRFSGETAWQWDEESDQFYLHSFLPEQPDLNWRNPAVRSVMSEVLRYWFDRGIDGFRVDVSYRVMKDRLFRDNPSNPDWRAGQDPSKKVIELYTKNRPDIHEFNRWLRQVCNEYEDRVLIGEINLAVEQLVRHYGDSDEFHLPFNFHLIFSPWNAASIRDLVDNYERQLPPQAWPNWVLGNHDQPRIATRLGLAQARQAAMLLLTLRGTPTMYYGDEIGMRNGQIPPERIQDPWEKLAPGLNLGRDPQRTPMQWDSSVNAGFCSGLVNPWLPIEAEYRQVNVDAERNDPNSILRLIQRLITLRRSSRALTMGAYRAVESPKSLFAYLREHGSERYLIILNFSAHAQSMPWLKDLNYPRFVISTHGISPYDQGAEALLLRGDEGAIFKLEQM